MDIYHGTATAKEGGGEFVEKGESGVITAYLPEYKTFAVLFSEGRWYTFYESEEWFLNNFEIIQEPTEQ